MTLGSSSISMSPISAIRLMFPLHVPRSERELMRQLALVAHTTMASTTVDHTPCERQAAGDAFGSPVIAPCGGAVQLDSPVSRRRAEGR